MLVSTRRASPFSADHDILLVLLDGPILDNGIRPSEIVRSEALDSPGIRHLNAMENRYTSILRILGRLAAEGMCYEKEGRWFPADPMCKVDRERQRLDYEGATKVLRHFLRCRDLRCTRDHFPDFILSDYAFRLMPPGKALGPP